MGVDRRHATGRAIGVDRDAQRAGAAERAQQEAVAVRAAAIEDAGSPTPSGRRGRCRARSTSGRRRRARSSAAG
ncbi:MAG: hypothetical protein MZV49_24410 [Rhodopseudomonas palustris]|nr:hypothetical protein [Rhodopseudomonas palustris]